MKQLYISVLLFSLHSAQGQGRHGYAISLTHENDFLATNNKDDNYTGGAKIEVLTPGLPIKYLPFYRFKEENAVNIQRYQIGATAYTPQTLNTSQVVYGERPYASLVYIAVGNSAFSGNGKWIVQSDIVIGLMGKDQPGQAQKYIHEHHWFGSTRPVPEGWSNQIGYDGSFMLNYNSKILYLIAHTGNRCDFELARVMWSNKVDIGNYMTNLQTGFKINLLNYYTTLLQGYTPTIPAELIHTAKKTPIRFTVFIEPQVRWAAYNATLEGLLFDDKSIYKVPHSQVKRVLFELGTGIHIVLFDIVNITYSMYSRSREFDGGKSFHNWGSFTIGASPRRWNADSKK
ncbi:MAG: lipid A deacylase LpxR family protein [Bacteroidetes bacterium]|nr:lipid A deacylase LpxR family protein [Bacteroidota bacterium]